MTLVTALVARLGFEPFSPPTSTFLIAFWGRRGSQVGEVKAGRVSRLGGLVKLLLLSPAPAEARTEQSPWGAVREAGSVGWKGTGVTHTQANFCSCHTLEIRVPLAHWLGFHIRFHLKKGINSLRIIGNRCNKARQSAARACRHGL